MPSRQTVQDFITTVEQGNYIEAIEQFYAPDASMQENSQPPRRGGDTLMPARRSNAAGTRQGGSIGCVALSPQG